MNQQSRNDIFYCQHLFDSETNLSAIQDFSIIQQSGKGLELYLKNSAATEEGFSSARTYVVKSIETDELAAYFTLKSGLFTISASDDYFHTIPSVELANFAVNSTFRQKYPQIERIGKTVFTDFILPIVDSARSIIGIQALYIYALPEEHLIEHYKTMGFRRLSTEKEQFVHSHVKPKYDDGCIFMYQML